MIQAILLIWACSSVLAAVVLAAGWRAYSGYIAAGLADAGWTRRIGFAVEVNALVVIVAAPVFLGVLAFSVAKGLCRREEKEVPK